MCLGPDARLQKEQQVQRLRIANSNLFANSQLHAFMILICVCCLSTLFQTMILQSVYDIGMTMLDLDIAGQQLLVQLLAHRASLLSQGHHPGAVERGGNPRRQRADPDPVHVRGSGLARRHPRCREGSAATPTFEQPLFPDMTMLTMSTMGDVDDADDVNGQRQIDDADDGRCRRC